jgi:MGT family glycosyltransferase
MTTAPIIAFFPEASFGSSLNCVAIAQSLQKCGAEPVFICHPGFTGVFAEYGFREHHIVKEHPLQRDETEAYWQEYIQRHLPHFNLSPTEQLDTYVSPTWNAIVDSAISVDQELADVLERVQPDLVVLDNVIMFPAIVNNRKPWVRIVSCAETEIPDDNIPPYLSGLPIGNRPQYQAFLSKYETSIRNAHDRYMSFRKKRGLGSLPNTSFLETSPWVNLILAPSIIQYPRKTALPTDQFVYLEGCVRHDTHFNVPDFSNNDDPLVYLSFGSLGSIDIDLIDRMIRAFESIAARFIVNVGDFLDRYSRVPDNVFLGPWFPQPSVIKQADLFIHHGGNNSFCEALYNGVPSLIMPYCWDGHDNATRADETKVGLSLNRATWTNASLHKTIKELLNDKKMKQRLTSNAQQMQLNPGHEKAADAILNCL